MDDKFKVASTVPDFKDKIKIKIEDGSESIYWYIKFNLRLDKASVTNKTCEVIDTEGYILRTYIAYDPDRNWIVVSPLESYTDNEYYILTISSQVKSEKGTYLKKPIHVLFKLVNRTVSKFEILKATVKLPESKNRPSLEEDLTPYSMDMGRALTDNEPYTPASRNRPQSLGAMPVKFSISPVIVGALLLNVGFFADQPIVFFLGVVICVLGFLLVVHQLHKNRSAIFYNMASHNFSKKKYEKAETYLMRAFKADEMNEKAEYGLNQVRRHLAREER